MISLKKSKNSGTIKIPLSFGVELDCQILDTAQMFLARGRTRKALRDRDASVTEMDDAAFGALFDSELVLQMAMIGVTGWTGVEEPCTPENVRELLSQSPWGNEFEKMYNYISWEETARKNGFAPWQNGNSLAGPSTAKDAELPASPAPEGSEEPTATSAPM